MDREYIMASEIQTIKKSVLIKCATYIEQSLIPVFQKENWEVFLLGKKKTDFCNVTAYDCKSDRDALQQVLSVYHFDLIVYDLREKIGIQSIACLEEFLQVASTRSQGKILFLSGADVLEKKRIPAIETTFVQGCVKSFV